MRTDEIQLEGEAWIKELDLQAVESGARDLRDHLRFQIHCLVFELVDLKHRLSKLERGDSTRKPDHM